MSLSNLSPPPAARQRLKWAHILWVSLVHVGPVLAPFWFSWTGLFVCIGLYFVAGIGVTMGYHRLLVHRSFQTPRVVEYLLTFMGSFSSQGGALAWVATHRAHHAHSDEEGDPHSPQNGGWWAHMVWWMWHDPVLDTPSGRERYIKDLVKDPVHRWLHRCHILFPVVLGLLLYAAGEWAGGLGLSWVLWGVCVRTALGYHATWLVNSASHRWGYRSHATSDQSTNLWWVALISFGEGWHNNHHAFPRSARHGLRWWEVDVTYWLIRLLSAFSLARHIHLPGKVIRKAA